MGEISELFPKDISYLDNVIPISQFLFDYDSQKKEGTHAQAVSSHQTSEIIFAEFGLKISNVIPFTKN